MTTSKINANMTIEILHTKGCQGYHQALDELEDALAERGLEPVYIMRVVRTAQEAQQRKFFGSPTVRIDGNDIDPKAEHMTYFGIGTCRLYFWEGKAYDYPPKDMITQAIMRMYQNKNNQNR